MALDEANEAIVGVNDSPNKRPGSPGGGPNPKRRATTPRSQRFGGMSPRSSSSPASPAASPVHSSSGGNSDAGGSASASGTNASGGHVGITNSAAPPVSAGHRPSADNGERLATPPVSHASSNQSQISASATSNVPGTSASVVRQTLVDGLVVGFSCILTQSLVVNLHETKRCVSWEQLVPLGLCSGPLTAMSVSCLFVFMLHFFSLLKLKGSIVNKLLLSVFTTLQSAFSHVRTCTIVPAKMVLQCPQSCYHQSL